MSKFDLRRYEWKYISQPPIIESFDKIEKEEKNASAALLLLQNRHPFALD